jgi:hypothetical protein
MTNTSNCRFRPKIFTFLGLDEGRLGGVGLVVHAFRSSRRPKCIANARVFLVADPDPRQTCLWLIGVRKHALTESFTFQIENVCLTLEKICLGQSAGPFILDLLPGSHSQHREPPKNVHRECLIVLPFVLVRGGRGWFAERMS